ncbi:DNA invertase Pin-like site-specific DNA recombinase [Anaerotaenia torta]|uniref:recombinase family protein n=1 Tax=Anaerotaenia torta TaxID=433293 RepID=UPI003D228570
MANTAIAPRAVTLIPAKIENLPFNVMSMAARKRVAAYARVSTNTEEQLTSYEAQVDYYTRYIQSKDEWEFVKVYTDEGISATSTKKRDGFNDMVNDALAGKIDLIITKSVSRFARNTVDTLTTVRKLKEKGVEVYFEKENIYTLDSKGELLITIMSSLAQEESRSISENVTWGQRKRFADGKVSLPYKRFLGYKKGPDGLPVIVEEEAEIVRLIYRLFLYGKSPSFIASMLTDEGILTPGGKANWRPNGVISILTNEKYKGDAILQKKFTVDFLTKKQKVNEGEVPQYYVANSHPAIIEPEIFDLVQYELKQRKESGRWTSSAHCFSGKIFCGECGSLYGSKVWHSNNQYRRMVWQCNEKHRGGEKCRVTHLTDEQIQAAFLAAFNRLLDSKAEILAVYDEIIRVLTDNTALDAESVELQGECDVVMELTRKCVQENAQTALNQEEYQRRYTALTERYAAARVRMTEINALRLERTAKRTNIMRFLKMLVKQGDLVTEFDEELWYITVESVTVYADQRLLLTFRDGSEISIEPDIWKVA